MSASKRRWFLPETPDVLGMLRDQTDATAEGMAAFAAWAHGDRARGEEVRAIEHTADTLKRQVIDAVRESFTTPLEPEDIYSLSRDLDEVLNGAKNTVREAEVMGVPPNEAMAEMATLLEEGVAHLRVAFAVLGRDGDDATDAASAAVKSQRNLERVYRQAMSHLLEVDDLREVIARQELYRRFTSMSETLVGVADRVWYSTVKES